jgi:hypothetical protein
MITMSTSLGSVLTVKRRAVKTTPTGIQEYAAERNASAMSHRDERKNFPRTSNTGSLPRFQPAPKEIICLTNNFNQGEITMPSAGAIGATQA